MKNLTLILIVSTLMSCNPFLSKETRQKNRCNKKLERVTRKCPQLLKTDTIEIPFEVKVPELVIKDSIHIVLDTSRVDSLLNFIDTIKDKREKIKLVTRLLKASFKLDTLIEDSLYSMRLQIVNGVLIPDIVIKERQIKGVTPIEVKKVTPIRLTWYEKILSKGGKWLFFLIILLIIWLLLRGVKSIK